MGKGKGKHTTAPPSDEAIRAALQGYKRQAIPVDPDDPDHIQAYRDLRQQYSRVDPQKFIKFLQNRKQQIESGNLAKINFWAVPKLNFPRGLPEKIKKAEVPDDELEGL